MAVQKQAVLELVEAHRGKGRSVSEVLGSVGVARSMRGAKETSSCVTVGC